MARIITIQPGQPGNGMDYDVHKPLPYPFHIASDTGDCTRGRGTSDIPSDVDDPRKQPWRLLGFQDDAAVQTVDMLLETFIQDPHAAVGKFPVFVNGNGDIFNLTEPITGVTVHDYAAAVTQ